MKTTIKMFLLSAFKPSKVGVSCISLGLVFWTAQSANAQLDKQKCIAQFIDSGKRISAVAGIKFDINIDVELLDAYRTLVDIEHIRRYQLHSSHLIDGKKYFAEGWSSPINVLPERYAFAYDNNITQELSGVETGKGTLVVSKSPSTGSLCLMQHEGILFPFKIFFPEKDQTEYLFPASGNMDHLLSSFLFKDEESRFDVRLQEGEPNTSILSSKSTSNTATYELFFRNNNFSYPEKVIVTRNKLKARDIYEIKDFYKIPNADGVIVRIPKLMTINTFNMQGEQAIRRVWKLENLETAQKFPADAFTIDPSQARYFVDEDKGIKLDLKNKNVEKIDSRPANE